uniref:Nucleoside diphosphate kinase n=1 Tax=Erythrolobus australicus TaxID=1077150 RepID=A0A7S1TKR2_9RHOD|mmetsp:Transcript_2955/g.8137  ORF Transcript_2955/g.8137 Transcript_2955/m.8137 type:complete len:214 (+) Transcript_2955:23-664(+)
MEAAFVNVCGAAQVAGRTAAAAAAAAAVDERSRYGVAMRVPRRVRAASALNGRRAVRMAADGPSAERTFIAIKPDGVNRGLVGQIIARFEQKGYQLVALKMLTPSKSLAQTHYEALSSKPFFNDLVDFICSGPVVAMVWQGTDVVLTGRRMIGATKPSESAPGTIRGDFGLEVGRNVIHGSDAVDTAQREIGIWFEPQELNSWEPTINCWVYE